jgi:hypothetical protein
LASVFSFFFINPFERGVNRKNRQPHSGTYLIAYICIIRPKTRPDRAAGGKYPQAVTNQPLSCTSTAAPPPKDGASLRAFIHKPLLLCHSFKAIGKAQGL